MAQELPDRSRFRLKSEGQRLLIAIPEPIGVIADAIGCKSRFTVARWRTGSVPQPRWRRGLWLVYKIPTQAWDLAPGTKLPPPPGPVTLAELAMPVPEIEPSPPIAAPVAGGTTLEDTLALLAMVRAERARPELSADEKLKLADREAKFLSLRLKIEQERELTEARYVAEHPAWKRLRAAIVRALEPYPQAAKAVIAAITSAER